MLYTSYFARAKEYAGEVDVVSVSRFSPAWFKGKEIKEFAPTAELLNDYKTHGMSDEEYERRYSKDTLDFVTKNKAISSLDIFATDDFMPIWKSETNHALLCCYEKEGDLCHRHLLSKHLSSLGIECREISKEELAMLCNKENGIDTR